MSFASLIALSAVFHFLVGLRLVPALPAAAGLVLAAYLAASALLMPLGLLARRVLRPPAADRLTWVGMVAMGFFSSLFVLCLLREAVLLAAWVADRWWADLPWQRLLEASAAAVPLLALAVTALGFLNARRRAGVRTVAVALPGLAAPLEGFRIVQISDIHVGPTIKRGYLDAIVDAVNALEPDAVAITGDLVDGSVAELAAHVAPLARLRARHGSYFVTGNHEYYSGVDGWVAQLGRLGVRVLHNEHVVLEHDGARLVLAGVTDFGAAYFAASHASDPARAAQGAPAGLVKVLLAHQPRSAAAAARAGFDLQLSGHTHGGQFLPWSFFVRFQQPFTAGLHALGRLQVYVSRGTGYWGPPKRFGAPSEITRVHLVAAGPAAP